jgi:DNA topoisomerase-1
VFINVSRKYNFDNLSQSDIEELIEDKLQKNIDKVIHDWKEEDIVVEKARWGRSVILKGKIKIELSKDIDAANLTLAEVQEMIAKKTPAKKTAAKKPAVKKAVAKKK